MRVAQQQFRTAYQNRKIRFVRPRSGDTNSAEPKRHLINAISTYGYRYIFEYITRKAPPKRGFSLKRKKLSKRAAVLRTAMCVLRSNNFARRIGSTGLRRIYFAELLLPAQTKNLNPIYKQSETRPHRSGAEFPRERNMKKTQTSNTISDQPLSEGIYSPNVRETVFCSPFLMIVTEIVSPILWLSTTEL